MHIPSDVYSSYHPQTKYGWIDNCTTDRWTHRHMDVLRETIIPHHYCVVGYKNELSEKASEAICCNKLGKKVLDERRKVLFCGQ